jgi:hypothetical protein
MRSPHPSRSRTRVVLAALVAVVPALAACGDDNGDGGADGSVAAPAVEAAAQEEVDGRCNGTDLSFANHDAEVSGTATTALARSSYDGGIYEAHVADFDLGEDDLRSWRPDVPEGGNVLTIQLTVFNADEDPEPILPGAELDLTSYFRELTFLVRHFTTDADWSEARDIGGETVGTLTITGVGDTFCFEVDYRDQDKEVAGTVEAPVFERL